MLELISKENFGLIVENTRELEGILREIFGL